ncbi:MAG TPA: MFS transporter [Ignavibacteriaceae bacterium]|nr:MFS transporter [Ignavibacteriaceae bacterium]
MQKPRLSFWQIWNMSFGFLGIQFGFALQNANVSRIFETLGASIDNIPILWIAAPVTGLIIQPIIGHMSDKTWNRLGRRRPYFLSGAILASIAIIIMPNSPVLWFAAGMLWIMDASINVSMEPFRAFVGDMLPSRQRTTGFAMQSFFIGTGAIIASALPYMMTNWLSISNTAPAGEIPDSVKFSFYVGGIVFLSAVSWTVFRTKEYSPEEMQKFKDSDEEEKIRKAERELIKSSEPSRYIRNGLTWLIIGAAISIIIFMNKLELGLYVLFVGSAVFGILQIIAGLMRKKGNIKNGLTAIITDLYEMPSTMKRLAVVQFFSWFALFAMWIYTTPAVTHHIYGTSDPTSKLFNEGADWVGVLMAVYNGFAAVMAFIIMWLAKITGRRVVHLISLICGGLGLASFYVIKDPNLLIVSELGIGLAWASILAMPYAILAGSLPPEKMGVYMGIFNFFIVIPQITAASILGFFVKNIVGGEAIYALLLGGASMIAAGLFTLLVKDVNEKKAEISLASEQSMTVPD